MVVREELKIMSLLNREDLKTAQENRAEIKLMDIAGTTLIIENIIVENINKAVKSNKFTTDILFNAQILQTNITGENICVIMEAVMNDLRTLDYIVDFEYIPEQQEKRFNGQVFPWSFRLIISW